MGSAQEFDGTRILGCFPENHEFGSAGVPKFPSEALIKVRAGLGGETGLVHRLWPIVISSSIENNLLKIALVDRLQAIDNRDNSLIGAPGPLALKTLRALSAPSVPAVCTPAVEY